MLRLLLTVFWCVQAAVYMVASIPSFCFFRQLAVAVSGFSLSVFGSFCCAVFLLLEQALGLLVVRFLVCQSRVFVVLSCREFGRVCCTPST